MTSSVPFILGHPSAASSLENIALRSVSDAPRGIDKRGVGEKKGTDSKQEQRDGTFVHLLLHITNEMDEANYRSDITSHICKICSKLESNCTCDQPQLAPDINLLVVCNTIESQAYPAMTISARLKSPLASTLLRQSGEVLSQPFTNFSGNLQDGMQLINNLFRGIVCHVCASMSINWFHNKEKHESDLNLTIYRATVLKRDLPPAAAAVQPAVSSSSSS